MHDYSYTIGRSLLRASGLWVALLGLLFAPSSAEAQTIIDITTTNATGSHNGATFEQGDGGVSAGSGNFDPFYQVKQSNQSSVSGYNTAARPIQAGFETVGNGVGEAKELLLSSISQVEVAGTSFREFFLDINQTAGAAIYPMVDIQVYIDDQNDLDCLNPATQSWGACDTGTPSSLVYWLDGAPDGDGTVLMNYILEAGSGKQDLRVLIPDASFGAGPECDYGQAGCTTYLYLYSAFEGNDDGFEEWKTAILPFIRLSKDVAGTLEEDTQWDITKSVSPDTWDLFTGDTGTSKYTITLDKEVTQSNISVSGTITIEVPATLPNGRAALDVEVQSVSDLFAGAHTPTLISCSNGSDGTTPFIVSAGTTVTCSYSISLATQVEGTNEATVVILDRDGFDQPYVFETDPVVYSVSPTGEPSTITVSDPNAPFGTFAASYSADATIMYDVEFACDEDEGENDNTATINETGDNDSATVTVNCFELAVSKTVDTKKTRTYDWDIAKTVDIDEWNLFNGQSGTSGYTVTVTRTSTDDGFMASGTITITNPAPMAATLTGVTDAITPGPIAATVDCGGATSVAANGGQLVCSYSVMLTEEQALAATLNTATATIQNVAYDANGAPTNTGTTDFDGSAPAVFGDETEVIEVDPTATVTDDWATPGDDGDDQSWGFGGSGEQTYDITFECDADEGQRVNTVTIVGDDTGTEYGTDDATVTVNCFELVVAKDANTTYDRDWDWTVEKVVRFGDEVLTAERVLMLDYLQVASVDYTITLSPTSEEFGFKVYGDIDVTNPAPMDATVVLTDALPGVVLDCGDGTDPSALVVPAESTVTCGYMADRADKSEGTNTATATLFGIEYSSDAVPFTFGDPTNETDECVALSDQFDGDVAVLLDGEVCVGETLEFPLDRDLDTAECGPYTLHNTASFITNDNVESGNDDATVNWEVVGCEVFGCTLTQGYWKTHNDTFKDLGGPPSDPTWMLLSDKDGDTVEEFEGEHFFGEIVGGDPLTWYDAMWEPVKGRPYFQLSSQWIAAYLNTMSGYGTDGGGTLTPPDEVADALADALAWFMDPGTDPDEKLRGRDARMVRDWASVLASFNEGAYEGFPHCDEQVGSIRTSGGVEQDAPESELATRTESEIADGDTDADQGADLDESDDLASVDEAPDPVVQARIVPEVFAMDAPAPNPARDQTTFRYHLPDAAVVTLTVYDLLGRHVETVVAGESKEAGSYRATLRTDRLPAGVYIVSIRTAQHQATQRLTVSR